MYLLLRKRKWHKSGVPQKHSLKPFYPNPEYGRKTTIFLKFLSFFLMPQKDGTTKRCENKNLCHFFILVEDAGLLIATPSPGKCTK